MSPSESTSVVSNVVQSKPSPSTCLKLPTLYWIMLAPLPVSRPHWASKTMSWSEVGGVPNCDVQASPNALHMSAGDTGVLVDGTSC